jgi:putative acetyltransferase
MSLRVDIRAFQPADLPALWRVFHASVHGLTGVHYNSAQRAAWAPDEGFTPEWAARVAANIPWVAERDGRIVGFADLQPDGFIDTFFVAPEAAGRGVGSALMATLLARADALGLSEVRAHVSLTAQPFFIRHGFEIEATQTVHLRGQCFANARMVRRI